MKWYSIFSMLPLSIPVLYLGRMVHGEWATVLNILWAGLLAFQLLSLAFQLLSLETRTRVLLSPPEIPDLKVSDLKVSDPKGSVWEESNRPRKVNWSGTIKRGYR